MSNLWFRGFDNDGGNSWATGEDETGADGPLRLRASPSKIERGAETRLIVETTDLGLLGKTVVLTVSNAAVAAPAVMTGILEPDAYGKAAATFLVTAGTIEGDSIIEAKVNG